MEVPFSRNPPQLSVVPQLDPRYADMAIGEAYSAYNEKALFKDTEISKNLEDIRSATNPMDSLMAMFDNIHKLERDRAARGLTPEDTAGRGMATQTPFDQTSLDPTATRGQTPR